MFKNHRTLVRIVGVILALIMCRLSYWQWGRHLEKVELIDSMHRRISKPTISLNVVLSSSEANSKNDDLVKDADSSNYSDLVHRRVTLRGVYDFDYEVVLRNRRYDGIPGVHAITPLKLSGTNIAILVNRGFIPLDLADKEKRKKFQKTVTEVDIYGLVKGANEPGTFKRIFAPKDKKAGADLPWVDTWLRVDIRNIESQLPYKLANIYVEVIPQSDINTIKDSMIQNNGGGRDEMLSLTSNTAITIPDYSKYDFPVPQPDAYIPAGRHFGYIFEWLFLAFLTLSITFFITRA